MATTMIADLINPQVMADMIGAAIDKKITVTPFAKLDNTLSGIPGNTITVPQYSYIGDAADVAEGVACGTVKLQTTTTTATVKKAMKAVELTDEAVLSGYGDPVGAANDQLADAIAGKLDADVMTALQGAQLTYNGSAGKITYAGIVNAVDLLEEEVNSEKVIFVHPKQVTALRLDGDFLSADKYKEGVMVTGEIGMVAGCHVVPSKRVPLVDTDANYACPIVVLNREGDTGAAAVTIYLKRDTNVETERQTLSRKTDISVDKHYAVALTNTSKVVLAKFKK